MQRMDNAKGYVLHMIDVGNSLKNYIYLLHCTQTGITAAIDPTEAEAVLAALAERGWQLDVILTTHHHNDHVGGNAELKERTGCTIIGSAADATRIPAIDVGLREGETLRLGALEGQVMEVSGHTLGHIAYYFPYQELLFSGDVLFSMGCGRLFEGTPTQMVDALAKITALPDETWICAAHEYTAENGRFAVSVEGGNAALVARVAEVVRLRDAGLPTVPVRLGRERSTNPFLRCDSPKIRASLGMAQATEVEIFTQLRRMRDVF
jgi:hydroxyacylglutathione hydrolase